MATDREFEHILTTTASDLRGYLAGMGIGAAEVDDLAQEAYLELFQHPERRPPEVEPIRWLKGIARNHALLYLRRRGRGRFRLALVELLSQGDDPDDERGDDELTALRRCLEELPGDARRILDWHYRDCEPTDRIAGRLRQAGSTVRKLLIRTRELLHDCICRRISDEARP